MKKILVSLLVAAMVGATLTGCGAKGEGNGTSVEQSTGISAADVVAKLKEKEYIPMPIDVTEEQEVKDVYHLNLDDVESYGITMTGRMPGVGFAMVVKAKEGKVDAVKASVDQVLADRVGAAFYPDEKEIAEKAKVEVDGNYVSLLIFYDDVAAEAMQTYKDAIK